MLFMYFSSYVGIIIIIIIENVIYLSWKVSVKIFYSVKFGFSSVFICLMT